MEALKDCTGREQLVLEKQASLPRRAAAYCLDGALLIIFCLVIIGVICCFLLWGGHGAIWSRVDGVIWINLSWGEAVSAVSRLIFWMAVVSAGQLWLTNGNTLGKRLLNIRVQRIDGQRIVLSTVLIRELLLKGVLNALTLGLLNVFSFVWANRGPAHQTVQDRLAATKVVQMSTQEK